MLSCPVELNIWTTLGLSLPLRSVRVNISAHRSSAIPSSVSTLSIDLTISSTQMETRLGTAGRLGMHPRHHRNYLESLSLGSSKRFLVNHTSDTGLLVTVDAS